jgi:hypothetical protein
VTATKIWQLVKWGPPGRGQGKHGRTIDEWVSVTWLFNIAMENGSFIDGLPIENDDFPWLC